MPISGIRCIADLIAEIEEDLTPYIDSLRALGHPATAIEVAAVITSATGVDVTPPVAMRRLKKLVLERGLAQVSRESSVGRPLLYELVSSAEPVPDDKAQQN
jgi:hypothetical protein